LLLVVVLLVAWRRKLEKAWSGEGREREREEEEEEEKEERKHKEKSKVFGGRKGVAWGTQRIRIQISVRHLSEISCEIAAR
jgi:hypothetical protein